ncbi:hypothetical protein ACLQ2S_21650 [Micromonospora sp. DT48]|uniref:hypothetical protein n=1 Tax=Micromonospora sp. DT48 TaxID=3393429 RepID=UPI003CED88FF
MPRKRWRRLLVPVLAMSLVVSGIGGPNAAIARPSEDGAPAAVTAAQTVGTAADGAELVRGVFFMQGEVGRKLERLPYVFMDEERLRKNRSPKAVAAVSRLIEAAEAAQPGMLASVSTRMRSGDPYQVEEALTEAGAALQTVMVEQPTLIDDDKTSIETVVAVVNAGAYAVAAAVVVAIAAVIVLLALINTPQLPRDGSRSLEVERLMALFATELRTI